ncbi:tRNA pseudouridine(38-40) synthase TruA [Pediococcus pentosaceus]|mgnify:FL=1|jgi:tRNA pseudouridine38-40 synthase|uniref:tRNA pseudouridine synthase A n=1 Tax=Pediococcus pentosaceus CGMCC 7049 TaxID=1460385 RepID=A0AAU7NK07_PEDPE|nr:tRNA pseudouridine(38-40) synthase TruA [Pediococcus pentosaceus]MCE5959957.1 tRNA pseudouridine(38-40) synthase TruA [Pediococcus pentosaceus]MCG7197617.1 tRNA pseudouridine(38-40) synthase TruA [Pediococcus pentosaceus]MCI2397289.1 tRNA pseudouridine(38-40) synthase TruA [Pediococcus pentosaceus]MCS8563328.1 tRNA pseudouridine(38-40) synthase TruA [Pediococcus pentosaceus]MCS8567889.1 tRNA pseudouridine(38-40) synthase TruA [Pediococcus pentosaceus]
MRYKIILAYDGTNFAGFQMQPNQRTVEGVLKRIVNKIAKNPTPEISVYGSGRTDAGVHALGQVVHFDLSIEMTERSMLHALNSQLPLDMQVKKVEIVDETFHARFTTHGKKYQYRMALGQFVDPFKRNYTGHWKFPINIGLIQKAIKDLEGTHDFSSFVASGSTVKDHVRTIYKAKVREDKKQNEIVFEFYGNGFLYNMVRIMVAVLVEIGSKRRPADDIPRLFEVKDRNQARGTAPASGLYLKEVDY